MDNPDTFNEEQYYYFTYRTCLTTTEVPDSEDHLTNSAVVNKTSITGKTEGPGFTSGKNGAINTTSQTIGGVEQFKQAPPSIDRGNLRTRSRGPYGTGGHQRQVLTEHDGV